MWRPYVAIPEPLDVMVVTVAQSFSWLAIWTCHLLSTLATSRPRRCIISISFILFYLIFFVAAQPERTNLNKGSFYELDTTQCRIYTNTITATTSTSTSLDMLSRRSRCYHAEFGGRSHCCHAELGRRSRRYHAEFGG